MKVLTSKGYIELPDNEILSLPPYKERVVSRIREKYSIDDEMAILRQRETKPTEFDEYNAFVEQIKAEERVREKNEAEYEAVMAADAEGVET